MDCEGVRLVPSQVLQKCYFWFSEKLECLGVGTPYRSPKSDNDGDIIMNALLKLVSYPGYTYFYKKEKNFIFSLLTG